MSSCCQTVFQYVVLLLCSSARLVAVMRARLCCNDSAAGAAESHKQPQLYGAPLVLKA
jgi:hypothetical protein